MDRHGCVALAPRTIIADLAVVFPEMSRRPQNLFLT